LQDKKYQMRNKIAAGNWKMNLTFAEAKTLNQSILDHQIPQDVKVILGSPFPYLAQLCELSKNNDKVFVAAQDCSAHGKGAYTGETAAQMLQSIGVDYVILGHSERRQYHKESDTLILEKIHQAQSQDLGVIYCCGEALEIREAGNHVAHVKSQLSESILKLDAAAISKIVIAYEPVWAIGTGKTASPEQAQEMHHEIRNTVAAQYGDEVANGISILYGGSVKPANAKEIFGQADVDGGLVGGASLKSEDFGEIIQSF